MDVFSSVLLGFQVSLAPINLLFCFIGVLTGTLVGVLPGLGPVAAMSLLLPITLHMTPVAAIIMMAGIYYGAQYGGSTTSILVNIPGEATSVVTCLDGYQMARQGRAGAALGIAAFGSFIAGTAGVVGVMLFAPPLASVALRFGPAEYFGLMLVALMLLVFLSSAARVKSLIMIVLGLLLGTIGIDTVTGTARFTFDSPTLMDGIGLAPVVMGLFGVAEVLSNVPGLGGRTVFEAPVRRLLPSAEDWRRSAGPIARGGVLGFVLGIIPGAGGILATFVSYAVERRLSRTPERFGHGAIEGVAGPEAANNAASAGAFIPLLTLGIPSNVVAAMLIAALMIHGIAPGPLMLQKDPQMFWGVITSMYTGNVMLLVLNVPLIGLWVRLLKVPYRILFPLILLFCVIGVYSLNNNILEVYIMTACGLIGYVLRARGYDLASFTLALVLSGVLEDNFRRTLMISGGDPRFFVTSSLLAFGLIVVAIVLALSPLIPRLATLRSRVESAGAET